MTQPSPLTDQNFVIIVAGGTGTRMRSVVPKQFILLNDLPVLMHTLLAFDRSAVQPRAILVLHSNFHDHWKNLCVKYNFTLPHLLVAGGKTRFHSVQNGLECINCTDNAIIAVHDAVRPLTNTKIIEASFNVARELSNAITAVKSRDSVRQMIGDKSISLKRDEIYLVQTPQTFNAGLLKRAYAQSYNESFTDDASVVEEYGEVINIIPGDHYNIKITFPEDIVIAELILSKKATD